MKLANDGSMRAVVMTNYGKEDVVQIQSMPKPKMKADEVLIEVYSAGINPIDVKLRTGAFKPFLKYKFPLILGADIAGKVLDVGSEVFLVLRKVTKFIAALADLRWEHLQNLLLRVNAISRSSPKM